MQLHNSTQISSLNRAIGFSLAAFSMFVFGYTASRVFLIQNSSETSVVDSTVIPHQATLWSDLGR